jgi:MFS family permease
MSEDHVTDNYQVPSNVILSRVRPSRYLPGMMLVWGVLSTISSGAQSAATLLTLRVALGAVEAGFFSGILYVLSCWYKPRELGKRIALFHSASLLASTICTLAGPLNARGVGGTYGSISAWRYVFLVEGLATIVASIIGFVVLPNYPGSTRFLTQRERGIAVSRLAHLHQDTGTTVQERGSRLSLIEALTASLRDPRVLLLIVLMAVNMGAGTMSYAIPMMGQQTEYSSVTSRVLAIPLLLATIAVPIVLWSSDYRCERRWHLVGAMATSTIAALVAAQPVSQGVRMGSISVLAPATWSALALCQTWVANTIRTPAEKRAVALALVNAVGNVASVWAIGVMSRMMRQKQQFAFGLSALELGLAATLAILLPACFRMEAYRGTRRERDADDNRRQDELSNVRNGTWMK